MKHRYKLGDFVEYYLVSIGGEDETTRNGFINSIEDRMWEDGSVVVNYEIGQYIGSCGGKVVCEEAIIRKLKAPKNQSRLEYLKGEIVANESKIKSLNDENKSLRDEIAKLEKEELE